mmetsp:Transcript_427/g.1178  ORF Transcript_427/g.1178 Transcript_427/m.1178 type:complete len:348 (+) Transcript_427:1303-2346(+)
MLTFGNLAQEKGVDMVVLPAASGPLTDGTLHIGDFNRLLQCANNAVSNALKFTDPGGRVQVSMTHVASTAGPGHVVFSVTDTGVGLSGEELNKLNEGSAFTQVGQGQMQGNGGTGLGLVITRELLHKHDGSELKLDSPGHGHGTTCDMILRLPTAPRRAEREACAAHEGKSEAAHGCAAHLPLPPDFRVLYVEDDNVLRTMFALRVFRKLGIPYDEATNGKMAVELAVARWQEGQAYNFIFMDNQMPVLTGELATRQLRDAGYTGQVIGMTGDPLGSEERARFESAGLNVCVDKDDNGVEYVRNILVAHAMPSPAFDTAHQEEGAVIPDVMATEMANETGPSMSGDG